MTNRFFNNPFSAPLFSLGRSTTIKAAYEAVEQGFVGVQGELDGLGTRGRNFEDLANVPASMTGKALQYLRVNTGATAIEFVPGGRVGLFSLTGATNTLLPTHAGAELLVNHTADTALVIETNVVQTFGVGDVVLVNQRGAGQVVITPAVGVTVRSTDGLMRSRTQHANVALMYLGADEWLFFGERNAAALGFASLFAPNILSGQQSVPFAALTDGVSIPVNADLSNNFRVTLGGNRTLANPTNVRDGSCLNIRVRQDGTGSRTLAYGSMWKWAGGSAPALSTAANSVDLISAIYVQETNTLLCNMLKGFA